MQNSEQKSTVNFSGISRLWILCVLSWICVAQPAVVYAQNSPLIRMAENWVFGDNVHVQFTPGGPQFGQLPIFSLEGSSAISDPLTGRLLFYTDGKTIYNATGGVLQNGANLQGGWSSTQGTLVLPDLENPSRYVIFFAGDQSSVTKPNTAIHLAFIDMNANGGQGSVTKRDVLVMEGASEKLNATMHCDGRSWWVGTHARDTTLFYAMRVDGRGVRYTVVSDAGQSSPQPRPTQGDYFGLGMLKFSGSGRLIATANPYISQLEVFDFNTTTGVVSNGRLAGNSYPYYGVAFSPNEQFLYSTTWEQGRVTQYDVSKPNIAATATHLGFIPRTGQTVYHGGIQLAIDGKIYVSGGSQLHLIRFPDQAGLNAVFVEGVYNVVNGTNTLVSLPNYPDCIFGPMAASCFPPVVSFSVDTLLCINACATFTNNSGRADSSWWKIVGDTTYTYNGPQLPPLCMKRRAVVYVTLFAQNDQGSDSLTTRIEFIVPDLLTVSSDTIICGPGEVYLSATGADVYSWQPSGMVQNPKSATTRATVNTNTTFTVTGTTRGVCTQTATTRVTVNNKPIKIYGRCAPVEAAVGGFTTLHIERNQIKTPEKFPLRIWYPHALLQVDSVMWGTEIGRRVIDSDRSEIQVQVLGTDDTLASVLVTTYLANTKGQIEAFVDGPIACDSVEFLNAEIDLANCFSSKRSIRIGSNAFRIVASSFHANQVTLTIHTAVGITPTIQLFSTLGLELPSNFTLVGSTLLSPTLQQSTYTATCHVPQLWYTCIRSGTAFHVVGFARD